MPDIMGSTLKSIIVKKELTSEQSHFMGRMILEPLISDITEWDAFSKYYKVSGEFFENRKHKEIDLKL